MGCDKLDSDRIAVAVRVRPPHEEDHDSAVDVFAAHSELCIGNKRFTFDNVFNINESQSGVFERIRNTIEGCVDGYNATVLAYGQTGSGKTYTMGTADTSANSIEIESGIIPRAVELLFCLLNKRRNEYNESDGGLIDVKVQAQFVELYNEEIRDLLESQKFGKSQIRIHEGARGDIYLTGVSYRLVNSLHDTLRCLHDGSLSRTTASTNMNSTSSRSHAIFSLMILQRWKILGGGIERRSAKLHFVDLAGSERMKRTGASGERAREGISINCGLLALGNVISALASATSPGENPAVGDGSDNCNTGQKEKPRTHIPYRDSKLTRLLADSLGGNSRTLMIACISPSAVDKMETLNTLQYASRIKRIRNRVMVNRQVQEATSASPGEMAALRKRVEDLEMELAMERLSGSRVSGQSNGKQFLCSEDQRISNLWREWEENISELDAKAAQLKQLSIRCHLRQQVADRIRNLAQLDGSDDVYHSTARIENELLSLRARRDSAEIMHTKALRKAQAARDNVFRYLHEMTPRLETELLARQSQLHLASRQGEHCHRMCRYLLAHTGSFQRIFCSMMDLLRREHLLLMAHHILPSELMDEYGELVKQFEGRKKVCWNDDAEEAGTECSSLSSCTTDSEMTEQREGVLGGVFDLRSRDLSSWLDQCVQQTARVQIPVSDTKDRTIRRRKRSGYYTKLDENVQTPNVTYNLRPRRSGSYSTTQTSTPLPLSKPLQVSSILNRTFDYSKSSQVIDPVSSMKSQFIVSRAPVDQTNTDRPNCVTPPISKPARALMASTVVRKRRQPYTDIENVHIDGTPQKMLKTSDEAVKWDNGLPLPIISTPERKQHLPMRVVRPVPDILTKCSPDRFPTKFSSRKVPVSSSSSLTSKPPRRLSFIPRKNAQASLVNRRATIFQNNVNNVTRKCDEIRL